VERYRYDTYGNRTTLAPDGITTRAASLYNQQVGFTGRYLDKETGLWYFRARYYSGTLGRFVSRDPLEYVNGKNLYQAYFVPNYVDPLGTKKECVVKKMSGERGTLKSSGDTGLFWKASWYFTGFVSYNEDGRVAVYVGVIGDTIIGNGTAGDYDHISMTKDTVAKVTCGCENDKCVAYASGAEDGEEKRSRGYVFSYASKIEVVLNGDTATFKSAAAAVLSDTGAVGINTGVTITLPSGVIAKATTTRDAIYKCVEK
jgi:RHS repeat-associated protein